MMQNRALRDLDIIADGDAPMSPAEPSDPATRALLAGLRAYLFPGGEDAARLVRGIKAVQRGEIRSSPEARWVPFTAEEFVDATRSGFCWEALMRGGLLGSVSVTDAYENGRGRLVVRKGPLQIMRIAGPEADKGELQRYLGYVGYCPPILLNHASLEWRAVSPRTLRVCDRVDRSGAWVDVDLDERCCPVLIRAQRPMTVGKKSVETRWSARGTEVQEREGLRVYTRMEADWHIPEGPYTYFRVELTSVTIMRS